MQIFKRNAQDIAKAFTKYSLWQGGGGGGGSSPTPKLSTPTILYNNTSFSDNVVLDDDFTNYDFITIIWTTNGDYSGGLSYIRDGGVTHPSAYLKWLMDNNLAIQYTGYYRRYSSYYVTNETTFTFNRRGADGENANNYAPFIFQVLGYKFE